MKNNRITKIRCVNKKCKTLNQIDETFCNRCSTPIVKNYLWIKGELAKQYQVGELIGNRFSLCYPNIVLDTKPDAVIPSPEVIPNDIKPYLKLFSHRLHIPQIYGYLNFPEQVWFLEYESVPLNSQGQLIYPKFFPSIESCLSKVSALRQMNWLWQIVQLWSPLAKQKALSSLFALDNIRVNGNIIKLIELDLDQKSTPTLENLGDLWCSWLPHFDPMIQNIIHKIVLSLQQNLFTNINDVLNVLDQTIYILGNNFYERKFQLITATDRGRKRKTNEDSCYPTVNQLKQTKRGMDSLSIVCDGLGGQDGGEVASSLAVDIIRGSLLSSYKETLQKTLYAKDWTPLIDAEKIYQAISEANNEITKLNNSQKRHKLRRMGTTATMGMALAHEVYLAHVGDSRIYWITPNSCHQVTIDDDVASDRVKKGDELYRSIAANREAGKLLQALGMDFSRKLKVHVRRFILDEDSVFLLCSDGLSDFNRVEQYWRSEILPIIKQKTNLEDAVKSLMNIGIKKNGHDNITIALLYCQCQKREQPERKEELSWKYLQEIIPDLPQPQDKNNWLAELVSSPQMIFTQGMTSKHKLILITSLVFCVAVGLWFLSQQKSSDNQSRAELRTVQSFDIASFGNA